MFPFDPPENIRKPKVDQKGTLGRKGLRVILEVRHNVSAKYPETMEYIEQYMKDVCERENLTTLFLFR